MGIADTLRASTSEPSSNSSDALTAQIKTLTEAVNSQTQRLSELTAAQDQTAQTQQQISQQLQRLSSAAKTSAQPNDSSALLVQIAEAVAAEDLKSVAHRLNATTASASEQTARLEALIPRLAPALSKAIKRTEAQAVESIQKVAEDSAGVVTARLDSANEQAAKVLAAAEAVSAKQMWPALGALGLALVPFAAVIAMGLTVLLGVVKVGGWAFSLAPDNAALWQHALIGLVLLAAAVGVGWLILRVAVWLDAGLDAVSR